MATQPSKPDSPTDVRSLIAAAAREIAERDRSVVGANSTRVGAKGARAGVASPSIVRTGNPSTSQTLNASRRVAPAMDPPTTYCYTCWKSFAGTGLLCGACEKSVANKSPSASPRHPHRPVETQRNNAAAPRSNTSARPLRSSGPAVPQPVKRESRGHWIIVACLVLAALIIFVPTRSNHCADGWPSQSIGRPGACSWHGGVAHESLWDRWTR